MFKKMILAVAAAITLAIGVNAPANATMSSLATPAVAQSEATADIVKVGRRFGGFRRGGFRKFRGGFRRHRWAHRRFKFHRRYHWRKYYGHYGYHCFWKYGRKFCY